MPHSLAGDEEPRLSGPAWGQPREGLRAGGGRFQQVPDAASLLHSLGQSLISWAWLSRLPNRPAGWRPGCSGEAPWHLLLPSLPAGKQQSRSQPCHSLVTPPQPPLPTWCTWHLAWSGQAAVPSSRALPPRQSPLLLGPGAPDSAAISTWAPGQLPVQLEGQRLDAEEDFPAPQETGNEGERSGNFWGTFSYEESEGVCACASDCPHVLLVNA